MGTFMKYKHVANNIKIKDRNTFLSKLCVSLDSITKIAIKVIIELK